MRDVNRLERAIILLALYVWQWLEALQDYAQTIEENRRGLRRGAADLDWQHTLRIMAAPVRKRRLIEESGEHPLPKYEETLVEWRDQGETMVMAAPLTVAFDGAQMEPWPMVVVTNTGTVVETIPMPVENLRKHRAFEPVKATRPRRVRTEAKRAALAGLSEVRQVEQRVRTQLEIVVQEAMRAAGLSLEEARTIIGAHHYECVLDRMAL